MRFLQKFTHTILLALLLFLTGCAGTSSDHTTAINKWKPLAKQGYADIPPGGESVVHTVIDAQDFLWAINLRAGNADPQGSYANVYDSDSSLQLGLEHILNPITSIEGIIGIQEFAGKGSASDEEVVQISINGRYYFNTASPRIYATAGYGNYNMDVPGSTTGFNVGTGLDYRITRRLSLEAAYNYHDLDESNPNPTYSTLQLGLRYLVW